MKKIMFYCQYLTGMGHLVRSTEIVRSLVKEFQVCFINGGPKVPGFEIPPEVELVKLPPLWIEKGQLQVAEGFQSIEEVKESRKNQLIAIYDRWQPDCLITEFFPFGRHKLFFELIPLLDHIQNTGSGTQVVCSVRDIVGRKNLYEEEEIICNLTSKYFDLILFHSDPNFQKLEESFSRVQDLNCQVKYTGFVAQRPATNPELTEADIINLNSAELMILVSVGGGRIGYQLIESTIQASSILEEQIPHRLQIFTGPFMPEEQFLQLQQLATKHNNVNLQRYTSVLMAYMNKADLSLSLTGYNTTMNILRTGVKAMVVPIGHYSKDEEQLVRTRKLANLGIVEVIEQDNLEPANLATRIITCINKEQIAVTPNIFDLQGTEKTALLLKDLLQQKTLVAV